MEYAIEIWFSLEKEKNIPIFVFSFEISIFIQWSIPRKAYDRNILFIDKLKILTIIENVQVVLNFVMHKS